MRGINSIEDQPPAIQSMQYCSLYKDFLPVPQRAETAATATANHSQSQPRPQPQPATASHSRGHSRGHVPANRR